VADAEQRAIGGCRQQAAGQCAQLGGGLLFGSVVQAVKKS